VPLQVIPGFAREDPDAVTPNPTVAQMRVTELNTVNVARLKEIIGQYGWPGKKLVGSDGARAAWLIATLSVGHDPATAAEDKAFLARVLGLMKGAGNDVNKGDRAWLDDRVATLSGQPQTYGTQWACRDGQFSPITPVRDQAGLEARRKAAGLKPLKEQLKNMRFQIACFSETGVRRIIVRP
jgi:hypothetical protein